MVKTLLKADDARILRAACKARSSLHCATWCVEKDLKKVHDILQGIRMRLRSLPSHPKGRMLHEVAFSSPSKQDAAVAILSSIRWPLLSLPTRLGNIIPKPKYSLFLV